MTTTPEEPRDQDKAGSSTTEELMRPDMRDAGEQETRAPEAAHDGPAGNDDGRTTADPSGTPPASDEPADADGPDDSAN